MPPAGSIPSRPHQTPTANMSSAASTKRRIPRISVFCSPMKRESRLITSMRREETGAHIRLSGSFRRIPCTICRSTAISQTIILNAAKPLLIMPSPWRTFQKRRCRRSGGRVKRAQNRQTRCPVSIRMRRPSFRSIRSLRGRRRTGSFTIMHSEPGKTQSMNILSASSTRTRIPSISGPCCATRAEDR